MAVPILGNARRTAKTPGGDARGIGNLITLPGGNAT
jgi:hypothetical protein